MIEFLAAQSQSDLIGLSLIPSASSPGEHAGSMGVGGRQGGGGGAGGGRGGILCCPKGEIYPGKFVSLSLRKASCGRVALDPTLSNS